ncbi:MAG: RNA methyltransferase [bacterium]
MYKDGDIPHIGPEIFFVLHECKNAGNMGAAARAVKNMGINQLIFVRPKQERWLEAIQMAPGAEDILEKASIFTYLEDALNDKHIVVGTTHRVRKYRSISYSLRELMEELVNLPSSCKVAILFGNERTGLTNKTLSLCQKLIAIPTVAEFPSINLAQAVMILAFEWHMVKEKQQERNNLPLVHDFIGLFDHLQNILDKANYFDRYPRSNFISSITQIIYRINPSKKEINFLRGILTYLDRTSLNKMKKILPSG